MSKDEKQKLVDNLSSLVKSKDKEVSFKYFILFLIFYQSIHLFEDPKSLKIVKLCDLESIHNLESEV